MANLLIVRTLKRMADMPLMAKRTFVGADSNSAVFSLERNQMFNGSSLVRVSDFSRTCFSSCMTLRGHKRILQKTPVWLSPHRGVVGYKNQREIRETISLSESETEKLTLNRKKFCAIRQPLL